MGSFADWLYGPQVQLQRLALDDEREKQIELLRAKQASGRLLDFQDGGSMAARPAGLDQNTGIDWNQPRPEDTQYKNQLTTDAMGGPLAMFQTMQAAKIDRNKVRDVGPDHSLVSGRDILATAPSAPSDFEKGLEAAGLKRGTPEWQKAAGARIDKETYIPDKDPLNIAKTQSEIDKNNASAKNMEGAALDDDSAQVIAEQLASGDTSGMAGLGYGNIGAANRSKVRNMFTKIVQNKNWTGADVAAANAEYFGIKSGERTLGTRSANIDMAVNEADQFSNLALEASDKVPRGSWVPVNAALNAWNAGTGDEATRAFGAANNSFINAYATAVGKGTMTVDGVQHARELLTTADGPQAYRAVIAQLKKEMAAAKASPGIVRKDMRGAITGSGDGGGAKVQKWGRDANGKPVLLP